MVALISDPILESRLIKERKAQGGDRFDEVWNGVYVVMPQPNIEHQLIASKLNYIFESIIGEPGLGQVFQGVNVSDRAEGWEQNYRVPDLAVFLPGNPAQAFEAHWRGGPDFAVEITSEGDRILDKLPFYGQVAVRELLVIERDPWALRLYRREGDELTLVGTSTPEQPDALESQVLPIRLKLSPGAPRPQVEIEATSSQQRWTI